MDDPWGSPWAEEEVQIHHDPAAKKPEHDARPTTPVRGRTTTLELKENPHSPWDDAGDSGFGNWAAVSAGDEGALGLDRRDEDVEENAGAIPQLKKNLHSAPPWEISGAISGDKGGTLGLDGTGEDWEENTETISQLKEDLPYALPWDDTAAIPVMEMPRLSPSLMPEFTDVVRQPSPDPWASEFPKERERGSIPSIRDDESVENQLDASSIDECKDSDAGQLVKPLYGERLSGGSTTPNETPASADRPSSVSPHKDDETPEPSLIVAKSRISNDIPDAEIVSSRPSSSPSEHSHHEENLQDSPRTSIDDEPKRPHVPRKVSSKIQELVEHFDSLGQAYESIESAREISEGPPEAAGIPVPAIVRDLNYSVESGDVAQPDEDMDDFGDFEKGNSEDDEPVVDVSNVPGPVQVGSQENDRRQERGVLPKKDFGPVTFDINTTALDKLYPDNESKASTQRVFVPDRDLDNTLASTEQRKTWYRISRYGTKRKHDTGDDENYVRANWVHSQMRQETLKIVARWMEEDRISGRVVLGGVSKGSSVFGWTDMKAAPVPIAQAFAAKRGKMPESSIVAPPPEVPREWPKGLVRSRSTSKTRSPSKPRRRSSVKSLSVSGGLFVPVPEIPAANFGRNSTSSAPAQNVSTIDAKPVAAAKLLSPPRKLRSSHQSASSVSSPPVIMHKNLPPMVIPAASPPPDIKPKLLLSPNPIITQLKNEEDEDEWGEMVASPVIAAALVLPKVPKKTEHMKAPGFGNPLPTIVNFPLSPVSQIEIIPRTKTDSSTASFEVLSPRTVLPTPSHLPQVKDLKYPDGNLAMISSPSPITPVSAPVASSTSSSGADPWASADFSFFEAPVIAAKHIQKVTPKIAAPKAPAPKTVKFSDPVPASPSKSAWKSKEETEQDAIVQSVVRGLPDLSYMLKR